MATKSQMSKNFERKAKMGLRGAAMPMVRAADGYISANEQDRLARVAPIGTAFFTPQDVAAVNANIQQIKATPGTTQMEGGVRRVVGPNGSLEYTNAPAPAAPVEPVKAPNNGTVIGPAPITMSDAQWNAMAASWKPGADAVPSSVPPGSPTSAPGLGAAKPLEPMKPVEPLKPLTAMQPAPTTPAPAQYVAPSVPTMPAIPGSNSPLGTSTGWQGRARQYPAPEVRSLGKMTVTPPQVRTVEPMTVTAPRSTSFTTPSMPSMPPIPGGDSPLGTKTGWQRGANMQRALEPSVKGANGIIASPPEGLRIAGKQTGHDHIHAVIDRGEQVINEPQKEALIERFGGEENYLAFLTAANNGKPPATLRDGVHAADGTWWESFKSGAQNMATDTTNWVKSKLPDWKRAVTPTPDPRAGGYQYETPEFLKQANESMKWANTFGERPRQMDIPYGRSASPGSFGAPYEIPPYKPQSLSGYLTHQTAKLAPTAVRVLGPVAAGADAMGRIGTVAESDNKPVAAAEQVSRMAGGLAGGGMGATTAMTLGAPLIAASGPFAPATATVLGLGGGIAGYIGGEKAVEKMTDAGRWLADKIVPDAAFKLAEDKVATITGAKKPAAPAAPAAPVPAKAPINAQAAAMSDADAAMRDAQPAVAPPVKVAPAPAPAVVAAPPPADPRHSWNTQRVLGEMDRADQIRGRGLYEAQPSSSAAPTGPYIYDPMHGAALDPRNQKIEAESIRDAERRDAQRSHPRGLLTAAARHDIRVPETLASQERVAGLQAGAHLGSAGIGAQAHRDVAGIQGATSRDVAGIGAGAQRYSADTHADALLGSTDLRGQYDVAGQHVAGGYGVQREQIQAQANMQRAKMQAMLEQRGKNFEANDKLIGHLMQDKDPKDGKLIPYGGENHARFIESFSNWLKPTGMTYRDAVSVMDAPTLAHLIDLHKRQGASEEFGNTLLGSLYRIGEGGAATSRDLADFEQTGNRNFFGLRANEGMQRVTPFAIGTMGWTGSRERHRQQLIEKEEQRRGIRQ